MSPLHNAAGYMDGPPNPVSGPGGRSGPCKYGVKTTQVVVGIGLILLVFNLKSLHQIFFLHLYINFREMRNID